VVTRQDKPAGRGLKLTSPPVRCAADELGIKCLQPKTVNAPEFIETVRESGADVALVMAFGQILSQALLDSLRRGFYNVHLSLLPELRGAAPVPWAIARGYSTTGVTVFKIVRELDAGPILNAVQIAIAQDDTTESIFAKLFEPCVDLALDSMARLDSDVSLVEQNHSLATFAPKVTADNGSLNFMVPAWRMKKLVQAFKDYPGTYAYWHSGYSPAIGEGHRKTRLRILDVSLPLEPDTGHSAGRIICANPKLGFDVQAGAGIVRIESLRPEGRTTMSGTDFLRGYRPKEGDFLLHY